MTRILLVALVLALAAIAWLGVRREQLERELETLRLPAVGRLVAEGLLPGDRVVARLTWDLRPRREVSPPYRRVAEADGDGRVRFDLPEGAFLLERSGLALPVLLVRDLDLTVALREAPSGFVQVPPGPYLAELDLRVRDVRRPDGTAHGPAGYFIGVEEVSVAEYAAFVDALQGEGGGDGDGFTSFCSPAERAASPGGCRGHVPFAGGADRWEDQLRPDTRHLPVRFVSYYDALAYARFRSRESVLRFRLPDSTEWEKAARGVDGRPFPWGWEPLTPAHRALDRGPDGRPLVSPYGLRHTATHVSEWTATPEGNRMRVMGASWDPFDDRVHLGYGVGESPWLRSASVGFRLVAEATR